MVDIRRCVCQREMGLGMVLWIDENTFATTLLEKVFKQEGLPFYTLDNVDDFSFLVNDLKPEIIVLDTQTARKNSIGLEKQFNENPILKATPFIFIGSGDDFSYLQKIGEIKRPFDPFDMPEIIAKIKSLN